MSVPPENIGLDNKSAAGRDRIEINHEIAGVDVGRMQRFLNNGDNALNSENSEKKKSERAMTMLRYMLENDAQYAKRYFEVAEKLDKAQQAVDRALIDINQRLAVSDRELQKMEDNSVKADDGTSVFKSSDGSIYDQDGQRLSDEDAQKVSVPEDAPSWEDYKAEKEKREVLLKDKQDIERYESQVVKPAQERMQDQDDPVSLDELDEIESQIESNAPDSLRKYSNDQTTPSFTSAAQNIQGDALLSVPDINVAFTNAANAAPAIPDIVHQPRSPAPTNTGMTPT